MRKAEPQIAPSPKKTEPKLAPVKSVVFVDPPVKEDAPAFASSNPLPPRDSAPKTERVSLKITDGRLDMSSVREANEDRVREYLKKSFSDPDFRKWAGLDPMTEQEAEELFSPDQAGQILDVLVKLEVLIASGSTGLPAEDCTRFLEWSEGEHKILDKQGARIVQRYVPAEWLRRMDLWMFLLSFGMFTALKFKRLNEHAREVASKMGKQVDAAAAEAKAKSEPEPQ